MHTRMYMYVYVSTGQLSCELADCLKCFASFSRIQVPACLVNDVHVDVHVDIHVPQPSCLCVLTIREFLLLCSILLTTFSSHTSN